MSENELIAIAYGEIITQIKNLYDVSYEAEHQYIHEFSEGPIALFKLILVNSNEGKSFMMVSFHIEVEAMDAIQWFMRIRALDPNLRVTACYLKDSNGESYVGEDAQILKLYMIEQDIISTFIEGTKDPEEILNRADAVVKPSPLKTYSNYKLALGGFKKLTKKDGDIEH